MKKHRKRNLVVLLVISFLFSNSQLMVRAEEGEEVKSQEIHEDNKVFEENQETLSTGDILINEDNFPDANFRTVIKEIFPGTDVITAAQIANTTSINVTEKNISNLKGIEHFTALEKLSCGFNKLTTLNISENRELVKLICEKNKLTTLNISENTKLEELYCYNNNLVNLDVSKNIELIILDCGKNDIINLNVKNNTELEALLCDENKLTTLDVSSNLNLKTLICFYNQLTTLDISENIALIGLHCGNNQLTYLNVLVDLNKFSVKGQINSIAIKAGETMYDLMNFGVGMDVTKISNLQGATLDGTQLKGLQIGKNVSYTYACGNGKTIDVVLDVKQIAEDPTTPTPPNAEKPAPTTMDTTNTTVLFMMMGVAVLILSVIFVRKRVEK